MQMSHGGHGRENIPINKRGMFYLHGLKEQLLYLAVHGKKTRWWGETWQSLPCVCWLRASEQKIGIGCCWGGGKGVGHYWEASPKFNIGKYVWFLSINRSLKVSRAVKAMLKLGLSSHFGCWSDGIMWNSVATKPNLIRNHLSHSVPWYDAVSELQSWRILYMFIRFPSCCSWSFFGTPIKSQVDTLFSCKKVPCLFVLISQRHQQNVPTNRANKKADDGFSR